MTAKVAFADKGDHLYVHARLVWSARNMKSVIDRTRRKAEEQGRTLILLDLTGVSKLHAEYTRFVSGEHLAAVLPPPYRVAVLGRGDMINGFGENAAVNRGACLRVFSDPAAALQWLLESSPVGGGEAVPSPR